MPDAPEHYGTTLVRAKPKQNERRKIPRYPVNADSEVEEPRVNAKISGRMTDLSLGGCYVDALTTFPEGTRVVVRMAREDLTFEATARVVFSKPGLGMGLAFSEMEPDHHNYLVRWVDELSGKPSTKAKPPGKTRAEIPVGEESSVLQQLITLLMQKGTVTHAEYENLLREIEKRTRHANQKSI